MTPCTNDNWVRRFIVSEPKKHSNGFTIYKVTSIVFPKGSPEAATKVVVWKRYNDFKKLHRELQQKHKKLYLHGKFPPFAEAKFFKRFENVVIEERRECATVLLEFIGAHAALFTSNVFVKFFESSYNQDDAKDLDTGEQNNAGLDNTSYTQQDSLDPDNVSVEPNEMNAGNGHLFKLGGTWQYPQASDSISLSSHSSEEHASFTSFTYADSGLSAPCAAVKSQREKSQEVSRKAVEQPEYPSTLAPAPAPSLGTEILKSPSDTTEVQMQENIEDYITRATHHGTQALQHQAAGAYDAAFALLKLGISCLLTGVQGETDASRRCAVRKKASEYLAAAEKLYSEQLAPRLPAAYPLSDLNKFKVLGLIGKVMLAMSTEIDQCYIVKVLRKSPCPVNKSRVPILPSSVPYMVKLHFYFETDSAVFLFLQHARGGCLWDHIVSYMQSQPPTPVHFLSQGNVYLGRKLIEESPTLTLNETTISGDTLLSMQDDSYASLIQDYREGRCKRDSEANCGKRDTGHYNSNYSKDQRRKDIDSYQLVESELEDHLKVPILESSSLYNPSENLHISTFANGSKSVEHLETKELMKNAQQLLQSVNDTLLKSSVGDQETWNDICKIETNVAGRRTGHSKWRSLQRLSSGTSVVESNVPAQSASGRTSGRSKHRSLQHLSSGMRSPLEHCFSSDKLYEWRSLRHWEQAAPHLSAPRLPEARVRRWAEQLVMCLASLHESGLVFRDLHPDNVLLSEEGHLLLSFMCVWPAVDTVVDKEAVEKLYAAPEVTSILEVTAAADWWSAGALLFELLTGKPLHLRQPGGVHSHSLLSFPDFVSAEAQSLLTELLRFHPHERLGTGVGGVEDIKSHPFFAGTDWSEVHIAGLKA